MGVMFEAVDERTPLEVLSEKESGFSIEEEFKNKRLAAMMRWARENGKRFDTIELKANEPELTHKEIARRLKISRRTVINHLEPVNLKIME